VTEYGRFTDAHGLLDLLARRKAELGLSNEMLDRICGFATGQTDKYLGPSRVKRPSLDILEILMTALGLSGTLVVDALKSQQVGRLWEREGRRYEPSVRPHARISKALVKRAAPEVRRQFAAMGGAARWQGSTPEERAVVVAKLNAARLTQWRAKRRASTKR
jgi:hypothetical protein